MKQISLAALITLALATCLVAEEPKELTAAKKEFALYAHPDEAARVRYVLSLAQLRDKLARSNGNWQAVDAELRHHPAPKGADSAALTKLRLGEWSSPRHEYLYRKDGAVNTNGKWRIEGNQYTEFVPGNSRGTNNYSIILLTAKDFIFTDGKVVFFEKKGK
jgi:hypothetical protein